jgi:hypothetical protein
MEAKHFQDVKTMDTIYPEQYPKYGEPDFSENEASEFHPSSRGK